jgi:hypothetical protein
MMTHGSRNMTRTALSVAFLGIVLMTTASAFGKGGGEELRNGEDTWIEAAAPHEKRGGDATLRLLDGDLPAAALIRFDLNELSGKGAVVGAHVRLKLAAPVAGGPVTVELLTVPGADRGWGATTSTWASINDPGIFDLQTGKPIRTPWQSGPGLGQTDTGRLSGKAEIETAEAGETVDIPIGDIELINRWVLHTWEGAGFLLRVRGGSVAFHSFDARALADRPVFVARTEGGTEPATAISYTLERPGRVSVNIYNEQGGVVRELVLGATRLAGEHTEGWDGLDTRGEAVRPGAYTWKLLQTQGLNAEYVMSLGVNPKTPWDRWPGNHNPVTNVAVDDTGVYFSAGSNEGPPPVVKDTFEGKRLWTNTGHFGAFGGLYSLATMDGKLFAIAADGRIHRLNATTGRDEIALADTKARPTVLRDLATGAGQLVVSAADQNLMNDNYNSLLTTIKTP